MKVLSLFSGVGGFDLGLERAGMSTVFQCEWDKHATSVLQRHWPDVPRWGDISTLTGTHVLTHAPVVDVVAWGSPCQDLSQAGKRAGLEGSRSGLFHQGIRIINELRKATNNVYPRISIWENVYGALNSNRGADFGIILNEMAEAGALVQEWRVLDAQYFGVPQRRRRVFLVSVFDSSIAANSSGSLLPVSESVCWNPTTRPPAREDASTTPTESLGSDGQWPAGSNERGILRQSISSKWSKGSSGPSGDEYVNMVVRERLLGSDIVGSLNTSDAKMISTQYVNDNKVVVEPLVAIGIQGNVIGRQDHNGPAGKGHTEDGEPMFTLTSTDVHAVADTALVRRLTPLECERLMGWPDDWTAFKADGTAQADTNRYKQCGNGVASPVAEWVGQQVLNLRQHSADVATNNQPKEKL